MDSSRTNGRPSRSIYSISHFVFLALRAATPSIDIWWKPTVFRNSYVASRIALRDTSLRLRPCAAVVDGAAANGDTPDHFETSRFGTRGIFRKHCGVARRRSLRRCTFSVTEARGYGGDHLAARCCGASVAGSPERATIATALPPVCKIGRASGARRLAPRALQAHCAVVDGVEIGLIPTARRAISTARASTPFSIEMLMSIAAVGVVIIGAIEEAG
jgi:hypothetical protein